MTSAQPRRRTRQDRRHSASRELVLREIEARDTASVAELSEATGLHENTVRGHLERLCSDGFLRSERTLPSGRGRPALRWHAVRTEERDPYASLAIALATTLSEADIDAANLMHAAGVSWGTRLAAERQSASGDTLKLIFDVMQDQGFSPEQAGSERADSESTGHKLLLRSCPILAAAQGNTEVVCAAHRGLVEGLVRSRGADLEVGLEPFAAPDVCLLTVASAA